jgi:hypothetical protein
VRIGSHSLFPSSSGGSTNATFFQPMQRSGMRWLPLGREKGVVSTPCSGDDSIAALLGNREEMDHPIPGMGFFGFRDSDWGDRLEQLDEVWMKLRLLRT